MSERTDTQGSAAISEQVDTKPELGHLVEGLDFRGIVAWAKTQDIQPYAAYNDTIGSEHITVNGKEATVGYIQPSPNGDTKPQMVKVENPGGEIVVIVEGDITTHIWGQAPNSPKRRIEYTEARGERPGFLQLDGDEQMIFQDPHAADHTAADQKAWYVCFYPEAEAAQSIQ